jgi:high-affinity Fe2+/Pb2+ permease
MPPSALKLIQRAQNRSLLYGFAIPFGIIMIVTAIVALIIGAVFYGQCTIQPNIPIFLIVEGVTVAIVYSLMLSSVSKLLNNIATIFS